MFPVADGLDPGLAAVTEPMAVALHAVRRGKVAKRRVAVVVGCGPVGLAVVGMLKATDARISGTPTRPMAGIRRATSRDRYMT